MPTIRYTAWDGRQTVDLVAPKILEQLADALGGADDVGDALQWLLRRGVTSREGDVQGLDQLLQRLREVMRNRQRDGHLGGALDALRRQLSDAIALERLAVDRLGEPEEARDRLRVLDETPERLSQAIEHLRDYEFLDADAAAAIRQLAEQLEAIRRVESLIDRMRDRFRGNRPFSFEEAVDLAEAVDRWEALESALSAGDLDAVDPSLVEELLGSDAAMALASLRGVMSTLWEAGYLTMREGRVRLSPLGTRRIGQMALRDIYTGLLAHRSGGHRTESRGANERRSEDAVPWRFGEPLDLDVVGTIKAALARGGSATGNLDARDFRVFPADRGTTSATVLLLDMSWSMSWEGRFAAAKRVAMALETLVRSRFPRDFFAVVGFYTRAVELPLRSLPEASWNMGDPFTNLQDGLRMAAGLLRRQRSRNKHVIVVTDGQPTAYFAGGRLHCEWPLSFGGISVRAARETLREVERVTREGIVINTFMLDDSPSLRRFVEEMTRINRGRALYTRPDRLGEYLLVDYLARKRKRV